VPNLTIYRGGITSTFLYRIIEDHYDEEDYDLWEELV